MLWAACSSRRCRSTSSPAASTTPTPRAASSSPAAAAYRGSSRPTRAARAAGIRRNLAISAALALAPDLVLRDRDDAAEAEALAELATWVLQFTPQVCLAPPDALVAEIGTSVRLFGGLPRLVARLTGGLRELGYALATSLAPTPTAALLLARAGRDALLRDPHALPDALAPLPLALCDVDPVALATLAPPASRRSAKPPRCRATRWRAASAARLVAMLDRALARSADPRLPFVPPPDVRAPPRPAGARRTTSKRSRSAQNAWCTSSRIGSPRADWVPCGSRSRSRTSVTCATRRARPPKLPFALGAPARARRPSERRAARAAGARRAARTGRSDDARAATKPRRSPAATSDCCPATKPTPRGAARRSPARAARRGRGDASSRRMPSIGPSSRLREAIASRKSAHRLPVCRERAAAAMARCRPNAPAARRAVGCETGTLVGSLKALVPRDGPPHRIGVVGRRTILRARLLRRRNAARRNGLDLSRSPLRRGRRRMVPARRCLLERALAGPAKRYPRARMRARPGVRCRRTTGSPGLPSSRPCRRRSSRSSRRTRSRMTYFACL